MAIRNTDWRQAVCLVLIAALGILTGIAASGSRPDLLVLPLIPALILVFLFLRSLRSRDRELISFLDSVTANDFSHFSADSAKDTLTGEIYKKMNRIAEEVARSREQAEIREQFFKALISQSATGLIVLNKAGEVEIINEAAAGFAGISPDSGNKKLMMIRNRPFWEFINELKEDEAITKKIETAGRELNLLFRQKNILAGGQSLRLISVEDIRKELDYREQESYQELIRILTHEIMNSVAPLTSVSRTLSELFRKNGVPVDTSLLTPEMIETALKGLSTIEDQGKGLMQFVHHYRQLIRLPLPVFESIDITEWAEQVRMMIQPQLKELNIDAEVSVSHKPGKLYADKAMLNQVVLNLVNNAREALAEVSGDKYIHIRIQKRSGMPCRISIANNGPQIPPEILEKIFIPFFTTREGGSGIGLALSRKIVHLHNGLLMVRSDAEETIFIIDLSDIQK